MFLLLRECGALAKLLPELDALFGVPQNPKNHPEIDTGIHTLQVLDVACELATETTVRFAALVHDLGDELAPDKINAIVILTDGRNEYPPDSDLDSLVQQLGGESLDTSVRVFPIGYSTAADKDALVRIAEASSAAYYDASDPATIDKVLTSVLSNF